MIHVILDLPDREAKALAAMCRGFRFDDAQHYLRNTRNVRPDSLCEAITRLLSALDAARDSPQKS